MNKVKVILLSVIALCTVNNNAKSYQGLAISKPFNTISNKLNMVLDNVKQNIYDNTSVKSLSTNCNSTINGIKNTVNDLKTQIFSNKNDNVNNLKNDLKGKTITFDSNSNKITQNKITEQNQIVEKKTELTPYKKLTKKEERQATKLIKSWVDNYLKKKNIKLFIANTKEKLEEYTNELNKKHSYNMAILNKMLIDSALCDILKNNSQYKEILSNNINYNILISLFALNADENKEVLNDITAELDKYNFDLKVFSKIVSLYNETNKKINEKLKEEKNKKQELAINNNNSFSIIGNKDKKDFKISDEKYLPKIKTKLSTLKDEDKNALLDDFSDVLEGNDNIKINNQSVDQYFKLNNSLSADQKLYDIIFSLVKIEMFSQTISLFNPFSSSISLMSTIFQTLPNNNSSKQFMAIQTTSYTSMFTCFNNFFDFGGLGFGYSFGNIFNFIPSFGFGTVFINSLLRL